MSALVLGASGQLGTDLVRLLGPQSAVPHQDLSITDGAAVEKLIAARKPDVVFNCAAYNAVDRAEAEPDAARAINADGAHNVAVSCARHHARLVHFSTNFVFAGTLDRPYVESDQPSPLGVYARSKLEGEQRVLQATDRALVVRTAALYGNRGQSFPERILQRARDGRQLRVVADQLVNPTYTKDLAGAAVDLANKEWSGIVHAVSGGCCGWDELAREVLAAFQVPVTVESISSAELSTPAPRPPNGCLESLRMGPLRPWREGLRDWARGQTP